MKNLNNCGSACINYSNYGLTKDSSGIYLIIADPQLLEYFDASASSAMLGRDYCGYHTQVIATDALCSLNMPGYYNGLCDGKTFNYAFLQVPSRFSQSALYDTKGNKATSSIPASKCHFSSGISPSAGAITNADVGYALGFIAHELAEVMVSPSAGQSYLDSNKNEVMDNCEAWTIGTQTSGSNQYNVQFSNGNRYLLPSVWSFDKQVCAISTSTTCSSSSYACNKAVDTPFRQCSNGAWINQSCGPGTVCLQSSTTTTTCVNGSPGGGGSSTPSSGSSCTSALYGKYTCNGKTLLICDYATASSLVWKVSANCGTVCSVNNYVYGACY